MISEAMLNAINRMNRSALMVAAVGILFSALLFVTNGPEFLHSYLFAWIFWLTMTLGCFGLQLLHNAVRSHWGRPILRLMEAGGGPVALFVMGLLVVPILVGASWLYPWADLSAVHRSHILEYRSGYMNLPFVAARTFGYFAIWILFAAGLRKWSLEHDRTGTPALGILRTNFGAAGMVMIFLTGTLAFTDWAMSLEVGWASTIYGAWFIICSALLALAFITILMYRWRVHTPYREVLPQMDKPLWGDLANLLLTLVMVWGYFSLSQFLIIWSGNLPDEVSYYIARGEGGWRILTALLIVGQFFIPFLALIAPRTKSPGVLRTAALWIIVMRILDVFWAIVPSYGTDVVTPTFLAECAAAFLAIGGIWFAVFSSQLKVAQLIPNHVYPPDEEEVLEHA